jgi:hypothetical protein
MPRHRLETDGWRLHDGSSLLDDLPQWNFTGDVTVADDSLNDETTVTLPEGGGGASFITDQWVQYLNSSFNPTVPTFPYPVDLGSSNYESDDQSLVGGTTNLALGRFGFAATGLYVVNFRVWNFSQSAYPADPHAYQIFTGARTTYWQSNLEIVSGSNGFNMSLVANIHLADWFAADETMYFRMQRGTTNTDIGTMNVDTHIARIL